MSQRVKKPGRPADETQGKRRRRRPSGSDADEDGTRSGSNSGGNGSLTGMWTPRHLNDLKVSSIYNRNSAEAPAELYRKDLISAMKLPDSEPLTPEEYWLITDSWKQEWEKGVQVPVNPESLPEPEVKLIPPVSERSHDFRLPKKKYVRVTHDDFFNPEYHQLVSTAARAEKVCSYDLDDVDAAWLGCSNADRSMQNTTLISEFLMEQVIEELELQCWEQVQTILKSQEGLGIEYDENVICDVCRSPESEEGNEMVFCDSCNICVHQACYGITTIPSGSWLCRTCTLGIKPTCVLCPNVGGAMKATRSGHTWAHVACAIWIPEVSIGSVEKMEPITKISSIPQSRWSLICVLCKEKTGACIQCSVKTCKTAYHVTCAFKNGLEMKPIIVDENAEDGIKLRSYCQKHSVNVKKDKSQSGSEDDAEKKKLKAMTAEERNQARAEKLQQIEAEFYKYVRLKDVSQNLAVDMDIVMLIYNYWKLKRKSLNNRPLVPPRPETTQLLTQQQEQDLEQMKMFVQLRQDLERVRNLCYMVSRREKLSRSYCRLREQTFQKQVALLTEKNDFTPEERNAIMEANHGPSIYDQMYSYRPPGSAPTSSSTAIPSTSTSTAVAHKSTLPDYDAMIALIAGLDAKKEALMNGLVKAAPTGGKRQGKNSGSMASTSAAAAAAVTDAVNSALSNSNNHLASSNGKVGSVGNSNSDKGKGSNPYKRQFVNGARRRNVQGDSGASSHSDSESERGAGPTSDKSTPPAKSVNKKGTAGAKGAASASAALSAAAKSKGGNRKPLSYLFDSDSSENGGTSTVTPAGKKNAKGAAQGNKTAPKGGAKGKGKAASGIAAAAAAVKNRKNVKTTSYLSDSDELELPVARTTKSGIGKDMAPIYSDSEESVAEDKKPAATTPTGKKDTKANKNASPVAKGTPGRKGKGTAGGAQGSAQNQIKDEKQDESAPVDSKGRKQIAKTVTGAGTPKGKGKPVGAKKGRNKSGFDPTELIVPQREAAKKATESIRSVKQKAKDQQGTADGGQEAGSSSTLTPAGSKESLVKESTKTVKSVSKAVISTLSGSDNDEEDEEEEEVEKPNSRPASRKGRSPERRLSGKGGKKGGAPIASTSSSQPIAGAAIEDESGDGKDEFEFDVGKDGSSRSVPSYVPQRQAAKKAAEHIRSGLSNIVAARLIIEDEMELARKKQKLEKGQAPTASGGKGGAAKVLEENEDSRVTAVESSKIENAVAEAAKRVTNKERAPVKGPVRGGKGAKKEAEQQSSGPVASASGGTVKASAAAATAKHARGVRDTADWPFMRMETGGGTGYPAMFSVEKNVDSGALERSSQSKTDRQEKGPQAAGRRSRERSSSSSSSGSSGSGSSSSGSSCSSRSSSASSSSQSSSSGSASPEPSPVVTKKASSQQQQIVSPVASKLSAAQDTGPGRKLKTSERCPVSRTRLRAETPPREKPTTKGSGARPGKFGSRGGDPFRSAFSPSPEPEPKRAAGKEPPQQQQQQQQSKKQQQQQQQQYQSIGKQPPGSFADHNKVTPIAKTNEQQQRRQPPQSQQQQQQQQQRFNKSNSRSPGVSDSKVITPESPEKKSGRRKGEPPSSKVSHQTEKDSYETTSTTPTASVPSSGDKRSEEKASLGPSRKSPIKHTGPQLSSESESDEPPSKQSKSATDTSENASSRPRDNSHSQPESVSMESPTQRKRKSLPESGSLGLSDSEESSVEEKQRADVPSKNHLEQVECAQVDRNQPSTQSTPQKISTVSGATPAQPVLSPVTPTESNDKEPSGRLTGEQPEPKRARLDASSAPAPSSSGQMKSIFSPPGSTVGGRDGEGEILDFDSELYELAKNVVTDEYNQGEDGPNSGSLSFSFSQDVFNREDNKEDSARATLNLVEKLRLQHARKSSHNHRPSTETSLDGPCDSFADEMPGKSDSRPGSSLQDDRKDNLSEISEPSQISEVVSEGKNTHSQTPTFEPGNKSPHNLLHTVASPDRTKLSIQGDERWVPPSGSGGHPLPHDNSQRHHASQIFIPNSSVSSPRTPYANLPEQSPPISAHHLQQQSLLSGASLEQEKHHLRSPSSSSYHSASAHIRPRSSRSSTPGDGSDKTNNNLSIDTHSTPSPMMPSPMVSPIIPGLHQGRQSQPGLTPPPFAVAAAMAAESSSGLPFAANPFMYPALASNPALVSVFAAAAAAAATGAPNPLSPFLQVPMPKTSPAGLGPTSPVNFTQQGAPGFPPFIPPTAAAAAAAAVLQQAQQQQQQNSTVHTPTPSPGVTSSQQQQQPHIPAQQQQQQSQQQRRPSDAVPSMDGKLPLNSPLVSVATSMPPPLAKPPLTSPSVLLAANSVKTVTPPPLQSAVAHIIESVVNNHSSTGSSSNNNNNTSLPKTTLSLDLHLPVTTAPVVALTSTNSHVKTPLTSPIVGNVVQHQKQQQQPQHVHASSTPLSEGLATDISAVLANKTTENIITPAMNKAGRQASAGETTPNVPTPPVGVANTAVSPKTAPPPAGRGRRASTPRRAAATSVNTSEKLSGVNAVIEDMMMRSPQPKTKGRKANTTAQSPARGKAPSTPGRRGGSGGRGRGKGKNLVGVRKDLAGTVYDIDFDEFEENAEEKIDLRALRERRKSSDLHAHHQDIKEKETTKTSRKSSKNSFASHQASDHSLNSSLNPVPLTTPAEKHSRSRASHLDKEEVKERRSRAKDVDRHHYEPRESKEESHVSKPSHPPHQPPLVTTISVSKGEVVSSTNKIPTSAASATPTPSSGNSTVTDKDKGSSHRPIHQTNPIIPGPVDMRTYSATGSDVPEKINFPAALAVKDPTSEIASLFMRSNTRTGVAPGNEIEDVEKALEVLVSTPKTPSGGTQQQLPTEPVTPMPVTAAKSTESSTMIGQPSLQPSTSSSAVNDVICSINVSSNSSQLSKLQNNTQRAATPPSASMSMNSMITGSGSALVSRPFEPPTQIRGSSEIIRSDVNQQQQQPQQQQQQQQQQPSSMQVPAVHSAVESDMSRNQLKVKIKGPFLDANYSSTNSMHPGSISTHPHLHPTHPLQQQNPVGTSHPLAHTGYPQAPGMHSQNYGAPEPGSFQHHQHHQHQHWMMSSMMGSNTSNLRRMRKKELLRQYWTQDMNMDGGSNPAGFPPGAPPTHMQDFSGMGSSHLGQHPHHPLGRAVITIPKAVASMSIIPTKEDYRLDNPSGNESNDSNGPGGPMGELLSGKGDQSSTKGATNSTGKTEGTQKKRRSRGIYREMAALGIITPDTPRERRRDRASAAAAASASGAGSGDNSDSNSRKRMRASSKPSRSTFIPPTLVESVDSPGGTKSSDKPSSSASSMFPSSGRSVSSSSTVSAVVNVVNHPTPKLKIKFGDLSSAGGSGGSGMFSGGGVGSSTISNNSNHLSDSDKETPNKKAKGRPPKKRGLPEAPSSSSSTTSASTGGFSMEELKRESMKYREKIMKDYAMAEQQEILKLSGTRRGRSKKSKRKAGASTAGSETDDAASVRSKSPEVKVIDGPKPKLILRFGKARTSAASDNNSSSGDKMSENGTENSSQGPEGPAENDSGFVGSGEGNAGGLENFKRNMIAGNGGSAVGLNTPSTNINNNNDSNKNNNSNSGNSASGSSSSGANIRNGSGGSSSAGNNGDKVLVLELDKKATEKLQNLSSSSTSSTTANPGGKGTNSLESSASSSSGEKYVPIRLKLSRCYEGYSLKNKECLKGPLDVGVDCENGAASNATNQSDSCQVR